MEPKARSITAWVFISIAVAALAGAGALGLGYIILMVIRWAGGRWQIEAMQNPRTGVRQIVLCASISMECIVVRLWVLRRKRGK
jgi:hypothetical protein